MSNSSIDLLKTIIRTGAKLKGQFQYAIVFIAILAGEYLI
jgi:hypothetical protein